MQCTGHKSSELAFEADVTLLLIAVVANIFEVAAHHTLLCCWHLQACGDHAAFLTRMDGHLGLANTAALTLAGITRSTTAPAGGVIDTSKDGQPTGILRCQWRSMCLCAPARARLMFLLTCHSHVHGHHSLAQTVLVAGSQVAGIWREMLLSTLPETACAEGRCGVCNALAATMQPASSLVLEHCMG